MRQNHVKMAKRAFGLVFAFLLSINSFAAVVSDNDGAAFITKAEFDSLKNDFQTKIDSFNASIDNKIDNAIASYLAGITIGKESKLINCKGIIEYPLTLRHLGPYAGDDVINITTLQDATKLWTDDYDIDLNNQRHGESSFLKNTLHKNPNNRIQNFYNGTNDGEYFQIKEMWNKYNVTGILNSNYHHFSEPSGNWEYWGWNIFMDVKTDDNAGGQTNANTWTRTAYATDDRRLILPTNSRPCMLAVWGQFGSRDKSGAATSLPTLTSSSTSKKWDKISATIGSGWVEHTVVWVTWDQQSEKEIGNLNDIMISQAEGADSRELYLPVLYDGYIRVTNIETAKTNINTSVAFMTTNINGTESTSSTHHSMQAVIDPGYVIDCESNKASGSSWETTSLINGSRVTYDLTTPYSKKTIGCVMGEGILLTELSDATKSFELSFTPKWDTTKETTTSEKKYILLSKYPITEDMTDIADSLYPDRYLNLSTSKEEGATTYKLIELKNNVENKIYNNELLNKNDLIYYKIVWGYDSGNSDRWQEVITIDEPNLTITKNQ